MLDRYLAALPAMSLTRDVPNRSAASPRGQCSPSAGFPTRRIHPLRSIEKDYRFETDEASFAGANFTAGGCELRIERVGRAR
jgi:hypothetical protein